MSAAAWDGCTLKIQCMHRRLRLHALRSLVVRHMSTTTVCSGVCVFGVLLWTVAV